MDETVLGKWQDRLEWAGVLVWGFVAFLIIGGSCAAQIQYSMEPPETKRMLSLALCEEKMADLRLKLDKDLKEIDTERK